MTRPPSSRPPRPPCPGECAAFVPRDQLGELVGRELRARARSQCEADGHAVVTTVPAGELAGIARVSCVRDCGHAGWWLVPVMQCTAGG